MIQHEVQQLPTTPRDLRKFGLVVGGVFVLLGAWFLYRHRAAGPWLLTPGVILVLLGLVAPRSLKGIFRAWMTAAYAMGLVVTTVLLTLFFFLVVTPLGLLSRIFGKDFLTCKLEPAAPSYWTPHPRPAPKPADYEQQF